jgi:hypothetical protein
MQCSAHNAACNPAYNAEYNPAHNNEIIVTFSIVCNKIKNNE